METWSWFLNCFPRCGEKEKFTGQPVKQNTDRVWQKFEYFHSVNIYWAPTLYKVIRQVFCFYQTDSCTNNIGPDCWMYYGCYFYTNILDKNRKLNQVERLKRWKQQKRIVLTCQENMHLYYRLYSKSFLCLPGHHTPCFPPISLSTLSPSSLLVSLPLLHLKMLGWIRALVSTHFFIYTNFLVTFIWVYH